MLAYITRGNGRRPSCWSSSTATCPDAGLQVPAGGVERWEPIEAALTREVEEEAGLR